MYQHNHGDFASRAFIVGSEVRARRSAQNLNEP